MESCWEYTSLWETAPSEVDFVKEVINLSLKIERLQTLSLLLFIWKHTNLCNKGVFLSLFFCKFDGQLSQHFYRPFVISCIMLWYIKWEDRSEKTDLSQLPKVSSAAKRTFSNLFKSLELAFRTCLVKGMIVDCRLDGFVYCVETFQWLVLK